MTGLVKFLEDHEVFHGWVLEQPDQSLEAIWQTCPRGDWLLWLHEKAGTPWKDLKPLVYRAVNRAFEYAGIDFGTITPGNISKAIEVAGVNWPARGAKAARAARANWAAESTARAAKAAKGAWAAESTAMTAMTAKVDWPDWAAESAAMTAESAGDSEHLICAEDCRKSLPFPNLKQSKFSEHVEQI